MKATSRDRRSSLATMTGHLRCRPDLDLLPNLRREDTVAIIGCVEQPDLDRRTIDDQAELHHRPGRDLHARVDHGKRTQAIVGRCPLACG